jgi:hypothetical protein
MDRVSEFKYLRREWRGDFRRRMMMVENMTDVQGWKEQEEVERVQERYLRGLKEWIEKCQVT